MKQTGKLSFKLEFLLLQQSLVVLVVVTTSSDEVLQDGEGEVGIVHNGALLYVRSKILTHLDKVLCWIMMRHATFDSLLDELEAISGVGCFQLEK